LSMTGQSNAMICKLLLLGIGFPLSCNGNDVSVKIHIQREIRKRRTRYIPKIAVHSNLDNILLPEERDVRGVFFSMSPDTRPPLPPQTTITSPPVEDAVVEIPTLDRDLLIQTKCGITAIERSRDILAELLTVSTSSSLINPETSQFKARDWLDNIDSAILCPEDSERTHQRYRLALLYYQMGGDQWKRCRAEEDTSSLTEDCPEKPFLDKGNECEWYGMSCGDAYNNDDDDDDEEAVVIDWADEYHPLEVINLQSNYLYGQLFDELYGFQDLKKILLNGNGKISGSISEQVGNLVNLQEMDFGDNMISGTIPDTVYGMVELSSLGLNNNRLVGSISDQIGNRSNIIVLQLHSNFFDGPIPEESLLQLEQLAELSIYDNQLEGSLEELCDVRDDRRLQFESYLTLVEADCFEETPEVTCSCCTCFQEI